MAITHKNAYVAQVSIGANKQQLINAFTEAEKYNGPSLIIAYTPCIEHGVNMRSSVEEEKLAVDTGHWLLYRYNPALLQENRNPFILDCKPPTKKVRELYERENRFATLLRSNPVEAEKLLSQAQEDIEKRYAFYQKLATVFQP